MTIPTFIDSVVVHIGALNTLPLGLSTLSTALLGAPPPRSYVPQVKLRKTAAQSVASSLPGAALSWDVADANTDSMWSSGNPTQVTIQTAGSYALDCEVSFDSNATPGTRALWLLLNGTQRLVNQVAEDEQAPVTGLTGRGPSLHVLTVLPNLSIGNVVYLFVYQDSGSALNTAFSIPNPSLSMWRIGP